MAIACFWIPANHPWGAQDELNNFLASHRVLAVDRHFVVNGNDSAWSVAVDYADGNNQTSAAPDKSRIDDQQNRRSLSVSSPPEGRAKALGELYGLGGWT